MVHAFEADTVEDPGGTPRNEREKLVENELEKTFSGMVVLLYQKTTHWLFVYQGIFCSNHI